MYWRINNFNGDYIYKQKEDFTHQDYKGRISMHGEPWSDKTASIKINNLRTRDSNRYFCQLEVTTNLGTSKMWKSPHWTELRVSDTQSNWDTTFVPWVVNIPSTHGVDIADRTKTRIPRVGQGIRTRLTSSRVGKGGRTRRTLRVENGGRTRTISRAGRGRRTRTTTPRVGNGGRTRTATSGVNEEGTTRTTVSRVDMEGRPKGSWQFHRTDLILLATVTSIFKLGICLLVALCFHWSRPCNSRSVKVDYPTMIKG
uniref:Uncharacterized protein LOC117350885 n=1 Tax=Geotrypetes seraphini TaxID=260995 RepID=A0A6P8PCD9_GEOSA|nr:uncharacterized protein LOC117350885 [Geotrypetes seraphini]